MKIQDAPETAYKLHFKTKFQGIPVSVENRKGSYRRGMDRDGNEWKKKMDFHYGRIPRTRGTDGDAVDVYLGPDKSAPKVYVIEQVWPDTGKFDEHKCMLGFPTKAEAIRGYKSQYNKPGFYGGCLTMTMEEFKSWLKEQSPAKVERRNIETRVKSGHRVLTDAQEKYKIPAGVSSAARQAIEARGKYGNKVKGGTQVGWTRATQLASGGEVSRDIVMRMRSFFARHEGNQKYEGDFPWGDAGYTAWKIWGGDAGKRWVEGLKMEDRNINFDKRLDAMRERRAYTDEDGVKHCDMDEEGNPMKDKKIGWDALVKKLMKENGYSKEQAEKIAYSIGVKKYGKSGMAKKAATGRGKDSDPIDDSEITPALQAQGKHKGTDYSSYSTKELALGIMVEKEHADDLIDRMEIGADHLEEDDDYYSDPAHPFMAELHKEYGDSFYDEYGKALSFVKGVIGGEPMQDADVNYQDEDYLKNAKKIANALRAKGWRVTSFKPWPSKMGVSIYIVIEKEGIVFSVRVSNHSVGTTRMKEHIHAGAKPSDIQHVVNVAEMNFKRAKVEIEKRKKFEEKRKEERRKKQEEDIRRKKESRESRSQEIEAQKKQEIEAHQRSKLYNTPDKIKKAYKSGKLSRNQVASLAKKVASSSGMTVSAVKNYALSDADVNSIIIEAALTPIIKKLMLKLGFKRLIWKGIGWVIPIGLDEYGNYLRMVPQLKVYDKMLQKFGYEISLSPGWFKIVPVGNGG